MPPELISIIAFTLIALECELELDWKLHDERPPVIWQLGTLGELILAVVRWSVIIAGLSLIVWSFANLPWYLPIVLYFAIFASVRKISRPAAIRQWVASALTPPLTAAGLIVLHWFTWFA